jgi:hypothetical protein
MNYPELITGYKRIISDIYNTKPYYKRTRKLLLNYKPLNVNPVRVNFNTLMALVKSAFIIGVANRGRLDYWRFLLWTLFRRPGSFIDAITFTIYGYHFRTVYGLRK